MALREGDLAFLHVHPGEARPTPLASSLTRRISRLPAATAFLQFKDGGQVHTAEFSVEVAR